MRSPSGQHSLLIRAGARAGGGAAFCAIDAEMRAGLLLECHGRGLAGLARPSEKVKVKKMVDGVETGGRRGKEDPDAGISGGGVSPLFDGEEDRARDDAACGQRIGAMMCICSR